MPRVIASCPNACNRFHECDGNYCSSGRKSSSLCKSSSSVSASASPITAGADTGYSRDMLALLVQNSPQSSHVKTSQLPNIPQPPSLAPKPRMEKSVTGLVAYASLKDVGNGWPANDDYFILKGMTDGKCIDCRSPHPTLEGD